MDGKDPYEDVPFSLSLPLSLFIHIFVYGGHVEQEIR